MKITVISVVFNSLETLSIMFVVLKLCGVINWSWWFVVSPAIVQLSLVLYLFVRIFTIKFKARRKARLYNQL
jgi:hypothetical protein